MSFEDDNQKLLQYWEQHLIGSWKELLNAANHENYNDMRKVIEYFIPDQREQVCLHYQ